MESPGAIGAKWPSMIERRFFFGAQQHSTRRRIFAAPGERRDQLLGGKYALSKVDRDSRAGDCNADDDCRRSSIR
jgi:hypothetical protein